MIKESKMPTTDEQLAEKVGEEPKMLPPAVTLPLTGRHLIEASAGTGKTWTLTGIMLRLIVEGGQPCEKIIATTFTRSAAAEMRQRIRERLQDFYQLIQYINNAKFQPLDISHLDQSKDEATQRYEFFLQQVLEQLSQKNLLKKYEDPINKHLIEWIAKQVFAVPLKDNDALAKKNNANNSEKNNSKANQTIPNKINFRIALQRTSLALNQLDRLFVSTLDSLCQKWLREYSSETGFSADVQISNDVSAIIKGMIHDQLRAFMAQVSVNMPELYPMMFDKKVFLSVDDYYSAVERALNFYTAEIDSIALDKFDTDTILNTMQAIANYDDSEFDVYFDADYRKAQGFRGGTKLIKDFNEIKNLQALLKNPEIHHIFAMYQEGNIHKILEGIKDFYTEGKGFVGKKEKEVAKFKSFEIIDNIWQLIQQKQILEAYFSQVNFYFTQFISRYVRTHLPKRLESLRLTTFALQLARLNEALEGKSGQSLARYIRHQYPIALIDESQDINTEQALLIQRVYLQDFEQDSAKQSEYKNFNTHQQFLLLVGDPKQAIYGFRGGDVENYTTLKKLFPEQPKSLNVNHRSSDALINSLNHWYGVGEQDIDPNQAKDLPDTNQQPYFMGNEIFYRKISATRENAELILANDSDKADVKASNLPAFNHICIEYQTPYSQSSAVGENTDNVESNDEKMVDFADAVAAQIFALFDDNCPLQYEKRPLSLNDICVLATQNRDLNAIEQKLNHHGIATVRGGSQSVFGETMSLDLLTLQNVLLTPFNQSKLKSLMLSSFFQMTLEEINQLYEDLAQKNPDDQKNENANEAMYHTTTTLADIQQLVLTTAELWQKHSFLVAIRWMLNQEFILPNQDKLNFWQRLAKHPQGERLLIDLRQLLDIISDQFNNEVGEHQLFDWFNTQVQQQPKEDWSTQQRLPSDEGVQLMTVHASKGLEFPIVFVVGFTAESKAKFYGAPLYLYGLQNSSQAISTSNLTPNNPLLSRRMTALPIKTENDKKFDYVAIEDQYAYEEKLRLLYVALTRAKEQVYLVTVGKKSAVKNSALQPFMADLAQFKTHDSLVNTTNVIEINSLSKYFNPNLKFNPKDNKTNRSEHSDKLDYNELIKVIETQSFKGWANTSFTALSRYIEHTSSDAAVNAEQRQDDDILVHEIDETLDLPTSQENEGDSIRFTFEKGTNPGTFLHSILEDITNNYSESNDIGLVSEGEAKADKLKRWSVMIDRALRRYQMPNNYFSTSASSEGNYGNWRDINISDLQADYINLVEWLEEIIHTPLSASSIPLVNIKYNQKVAELGFNLRLSQHLSFSALNDLFKHYNIPLQLQNQEINSMVWQYLKGEIDLVYQHNEKFYIIDYKSNFLGSNLNKYNQNALYEAMTAHSYWLQASIYQVALHRYLKIRLPNYDINTHLGPVEYVFLRGMSPTQHEAGKLVKKFDTKFILELDEMFGYPAALTKS